MTIRTATDCISSHFRENKKFYIGVTVGGALVYFAVDKKVSAKVTNLVIGNWKPTVTNNTTIMQELVRRGHPGFHIRNAKTGEEFASITRAAEMYNIPRETLRRHLNGDISAASGHVFEKLGEMT